MADLGVSVTSRGLEATLDLPNAERVWLCVYEGDQETQRFELARGDDRIFRGLAPGLGPGTRYGFRVGGPYDPSRGKRFDASKLLADPYAWAFDRPFHAHPSMSVFGHDSGADAPKAIAGAPRAGEPGRRRVADDKLIIYELNLRGFSRLNPAVPEAARSTFAGLAHPSSIAHLAALGVTAVEIMPAEPFIDERHLPPLGLSNSWGYNSVVFGLPDPRLAPGGWAEVRSATDALHAAGIEAILDVVYNHNGESDQFGPTISFRGLDNETFFRLDPHDRALYFNDTGCGNSVAIDRPMVCAMAVGALNRWMIHGGFDGFRFDLATTLGRTDHGFDPNCPFFVALAQDPLLKTARLIAEPWDVGWGGYQLGHFRNEFAEWNDHYRDTARRFWRGDSGMRGEIATRIAGSHDIFGAPTPSKGVNFIVAHDGFTLADLVAYDRKHNEANGEHNRDGTDANFSWSHGVEGPTDDPAILAARARDQRNLMTLLFASRGTPMLSMGSELGFTQDGNNNAYTQDNETTSIRWGSVDSTMIAFTRRLASIRRDRPALSHDSFLTGQPFDASGLPDVEWRDAEGPLTPERWNDATGAVLVAVFAAPHGGGIDRVAVAMNRSRDDSELVLPEPREGMAWRMLADTANPDAPDRAPAIADRQRLQARSCLVLGESPAPSGPFSGPPRAESVDALATAAGLAAEWWDVAGKRTIVSPETKIALLKALGLDSASEAQARDSLNHVLNETRLRRIPPSLVLREGEPFAAPLRDTPGACEARIEREDGEAVEWRVAEGEAMTSALPDGREVSLRAIPLPDLPVGRHRLIVDGVESLLTVAPQRTHAPEGASRKRFGVSAQIYAMRRAGDQGMGDFSTLALAGEAAAGAGAAYLGVSPMHMLFPHDRERASPYHPSDRRFLDPILIDVLDPDLRRGETVEAALSALAPAIAAASATKVVDYPAVWAIKRQALTALHWAFSVARLKRPDDPLVAEYRAFIAAGAESLRRFAAFQAYAATEAGPNWRTWPQPLRDAEAAAIDAAIGENADAFDFALFCQWLADRQLGRAENRAKAKGLDVGFYRDLAVGAAPDGAEAWARGAELAQGVDVGAPPDPFSIQGQNWNLPAPNPLAGARTGWAGINALYAANMRHAGMLRIDHAMGLQRLFIIPSGAKPGDGAYLAYPLDDLIGHIAVESQRAQCMVIGEDLGTVADGFRARMRGAGVLGMRVLWFERKGAEVLPPADYPPLSVACVATHDLPTLAGWRQGADIGERMTLGHLTLARAGDSVTERRAQLKGLVDALISAGLLAFAPEEDAALDEASASAVHALISGAGSLFASAQYDDLVGETIATNLPGTDRERPNWRIKVGADVSAAFASRRARAILAALARGRK